MPTAATLEEVTTLARGHSRLFVRWSRGPDADAAGPSSDDLTGVALPGLSANPLAVEPWWGDRPLRLWIARRLYDYSHLKHEKGPGVRPWILEGRVQGRGPDNEPLVRCDRPVAWIARQVIDEAEQTMEKQNDHWGPLRRPAADCTSLIRASSLAVFWGPAAARVNGRPPRRGYGIAAHLEIAPRPRKQPLWQEPAKGHGWLDNRRFLLAPQCRFHRGASQKFAAFTGLGHVPAAPASSARCMVMGAWVAAFPSALRGHHPAGWPPSAGPGSGHRRATRGSRQP